MPKNGIVTDVEFSNIQFLHNRGCKNSEICRITGRSEDTIRRCLKETTYPGYVQANKNARVARNEREQLSRMRDALGNEPIQEEMQFDTTPIWVLALKDIAKQLELIYLAVDRLNGD